MWILERILGENFSKNPTTLLDKKNENAINKSFMDTTDKGSSNSDARGNSYFVKKASDDS